MTELRIKELMARKKLNATDLSHMTFIDKSAISRILKGDQALKLEHLDAIAWALGCTVSDLFTGQPQPPQRVQDLIDPLIRGRGARGEGNERREADSAG